MIVETFSPFVQSDASTCIGCRTCEIACAMAHSESGANTAGATEGVFMPRLFVMVAPEISAPVQCHHCEDAPCRNICQMSAISRINGRTVVDTARCVGCKLCLMACPFGAIEFVPLPAGTRPIFPGASAKTDTPAARRFHRASNCDLCVDRAGGQACVETCPQKALALLNPAAERSRRNVEAALDLLLQAGGDLVEKE
jgi:electron transport protein HydN